MKAMTNSTHDSFNRIAIDSTILFGVGLVTLISLGTFLENGDINAGSMYGLFILPLLPLIIVSLGLIELSKGWLSGSKRWVAPFAPLILVLGCPWLEPFNAYLLVGTVISIILLNLAKHERVKKTAQRLFSDQLL
ncbi:hypothetical protein GZH53_00780 [Flavihumibacter sp. R14]|nr:hypothetical protein [Flavihumibacter soli]